MPFNVPVLVTISKQANIKATEKDVDKAVKEHEVNVNHAVLPRV
jgi:hypothetical protein